MQINLNKNLFERSRAKHTFRLIILSVLALAIRFVAFELESGDYTDFLKPWILFLQDNGYLAAFKFQFADYTPLYLYYLTAIAYFKLEPLIWIKLLSVVFDFIIAIYVRRIILLRFKDNTILADAAYILALFIPTILLNGGFWGQCDSVYSCFLLMTVFYLFKEDKIKALICFGIAFSLKLQSIFLLPLLFLYFLDKKIKFIDFLIIPGIYILSVIPAVAGGASLFDQLTVYLRQTGTYPQLQLNFPNIYRWLPNNQIFLWLGIAATFITALFFCIAAHKKKMLGKPGFLLDFAYFTTLLIPFFLPKMHDRYMFPADVFAIIYLIHNQKRWYIPVIMWFASLCTYMSYLTGIALVDFRLLAVIYLVALIFLAADIWKKYSSVETNSVESINNSENINVPS